MKTNTKLKPYVKKEPKGNRPNKIPKGNREV